MAKKKSVSVNDPFIRQESMITESGHLVEKGDLIKVSGQHGMVFKFHCLTTNPKVNKTWVDCFEIYRGIVGAARSFYPDSIKPVVKRGKRVKRNSDS